MQLLPTIADSNKTFDQTKVSTLAGNYCQQLVVVNNLPANMFQILYQHNTETLIELLPNNTTHISRHQTILTFSDSYW